MPTKYFGNMNPSQLGNFASMASPSPTNTQSNGLSDPKKQDRMELLTYVKAHLDLVAVTLLVAYLSYSIVQLRRMKK